VRHPTGVSPADPAIVCPVTFDHACKFNSEFAPLKEAQTRNPGNGCHFTGNKAVDAEYSRLITARALQEAWKMNKEAYPRASTYAEESATFFRALTSQSRSILKVGTDCSGMEAPIQALRNLGVKFDHVFSSDSDPAVKKTIMENFRPQHFYDDITVRNNSEAPSVDLYMAGFPCQPFSVAGRQEGFKDSQGRGEIFFHVVDYLKQKRPRIFILENVKGLVTLEEGKYHRAILAHLRSIGKAPNDGAGAYNVSWKVLNTAEHGIPHYRTRWYCVGILRTTTQGRGQPRAFEWPAPIRSLRIGTFLDPSHLSLDQAEESAHVKENLETALHQIKKAGGDPTRTTYVVDCDASKDRMKWMQERSPCITRSRFKGHWLTSRGRRMTILEMFRLQGMDHTKFSPKVSPDQLGKQIGNSMSVNVVERLLRVVLQSTGDLSDKAPDRWENRTAVKQLLGCRGKVFKRTRVNELDNQAVRLNKRWLIVDSGASYHIIDSSALTKEELATVRELEQPVQLMTANGPVEACQVADIYVEDLDFVVTALILDDSPPLLSLGKLTKDNGFDYIWRSKQPPCLISPQGRKIWCTEMKNVPVITTGSGNILENPLENPKPSSQAGGDPKAPQTGGNAGAKADAGGNTAPKDELSDEWRQQAKGWVRLHRRPRKTLFTPTGTSNGPDVSTLSGRRITKFVFADGKKDIRHDNWEDETTAHQEQSGKWTGYTLFPFKKTKAAQLCKPCKPINAKHNMITHFPKDPNCEICQNSKTTRAYLRQHPHSENSTLPEPKAFGDSVTADHAILNEDDASRDHDKIAFVIQDRKTLWLQGYPAPTKNTDDTKAAFQRFFGPQRKPEHVYSDNSKEISKACKELGYLHDTCTPHRPATNGVAERAVRRVKEGTSCALDQSGFTAAWWVQAMICFCFLRNVIDVHSDGLTAWEKRFGSKFKGPIIPYGAKIKYHPITDKDKARLHKFGGKMLPGIFQGYVQQAGGGWNGELMISDCEEISQAQHTSDIYIKRFKASEVYVTLESGSSQNTTKDTQDFIFPLANGSLSQPEVGARRLTGRRHRAEPAEVDPDESIPEAPQQIANEPDFWTIQGDTITRTHRTPRTKLFQPQKKSG